MGSVIFLGTVQLFAMFEEVEYHGDLIHHFEQKGLMRMMEMIACMYVCEGDSASYQANWKGFLTL